VFSDRKLDNSAPLITGAMIITGCVLVGFATVGRLWCAQYIAGYKTVTLVTEGPYSICRNPLYFFSLLGGIGVGLFTESFTLVTIIAVVFAVIYPITIRTEERRLRSVFGDDYDRYTKSVPRFIPDLSKFHEPAKYAVNTEVFRREIVDAGFFTWIVGFFKAIEILTELLALPTYFSIY
jgi:uncharacterized membrane protein